MTLTRLSRIPKRIRDDLKIIRITNNWKEILAVKLNNKPLTSIRLRNGVVLNSPEEVSLNFLFHEIWLDEFYAPFGYEIKPNETVVDIGANIGVFATWAATRAPDVKVLSFEPFAANAEYFKANQAASGLDNIEFHAAAVADSNCKRTLHVSDSWILHSLTDRDSNEGGVEVDCVSLDNALTDVERCDFLKLDCEGAEYEILYAASQNTIAKIGRLVCEFNVLDESERNGNKLGIFLSANGFIVDDLRLLDETSGFICARRLRFDA
jgi:FkbM family methyltransferase